MALQTFKERLQAYYDRYERYIPVVSFLGGFLWDSLTLTRIDRISDNLILLAYLLLAGVAIVLIHLIDQHRITHPQIMRFREWYPWGLQFLFGGLFSSYVVFYFQSVTMNQSVIFFILLVLLLVGNEFLEKRLDNLYLQIALFTLSAFSFFIFFIPIVLKRLSWWTVGLAVVASGFLVSMLLWVLHRQQVFQPPYSLKRVGTLATGLIGVLLLFYGLNWIPPVPLSLKFGGVYHHVHREGDRYILRYEKPPWYQFWVKYDREFHYQPGDTVFCFTAVFAPTLLNTKIYHHWQYWDAGAEKWVTTDRRGFQLTGGREKGYRGYTYKRNVRPGRWRVDVENQLRQVLGRIDFELKEGVVQSFNMIIY